MTYSRFKRWIDVMGALCGIVAFAPVWPLIALAIKIDSPGPVLFRQTRIGFQAKEFCVFKFRSMYLGAEKLGVYEQKDDPRVTRVGRFLRRTSINELPQLLNVLKGEMALVGPRPVLPFHPWPLADYTVAQRKRFEVRPGLTGWAQVNGRKNVSWARRLELDAEYVDNLSFAFDVRIILKTVATVLSARGNYNEDIPSGANK